MLKRMSVYFKKRFKIYPKKLISHTEGDLLEKLASKAKLAIVEIGSWLGYSTIRLANQSSVKIYAIDPHQGTHTHTANNIEQTYPLFLSNIIKAKGAHKIIPLLMTSEEAYKTCNNLKCDLIFIDGSHKFEDVKLDFKLWSKRLVIDGIIAFHDIGNSSIPGPTQVWEEFVVNNPHFEVLGHKETIYYARKVIST